MCNQSKPGSWLFIDQWPDEDQPHWVKYAPLYIYIYSDSGYAVITDHALFNIFVVEILRCFVKTRGYF